jgi:hypothetical protein
VGSNVLQANTKQEGFYTLQISASALPAANLNPPYKLSVTYAAPQAFKAAAPSASPQVAGQWGPAFQLKNVAIHAHLLPTGKVLYWGRRQKVGNVAFASLNEHFSTTFLWDPATGQSAPTKNSRAVKVHPIAALQTEYSLWTRDPEDEILPAVDTPMNPGDAHEFLKKLSPLKRLARVEEVADLLLYLEPAPFVNGEIVHLDGGAHAGKR